MMLDKINKAIQTRSNIRAHDTDALRIVDGQGDGFDDLTVDDFAGRWLVETRGGDFPEWLKAATQPEAIYWKKLGEKESPRWMAGRKVEEPFVVTENGVRYRIDFQAGYSQGLFLDQRDNRLAMRQMANGRSVLNCFAYTCGFGVCAAIGGGNTVNLDLSKRYLEWGKANYALNGIDPAKHDFIYGDVMDWLNRFRKKGRKFDVVLLDPPTFSRNEKGDVFTVESGFGGLVKAAVDVLGENGVIFCSTNQRSMGVGDFRRIITSELEDAWEWQLRNTPMPADFRGEDYLKTWWMERVGGEM